MRDITPELPIRLAGYAGRKRPADKVDHPLLVQALALKNPSGERFVFVALDNCEVSHAFMQPVLQQLADQFQLGRGAVAVVSSHTHSAPVLEQTLTDMAQPPPADRERDREIQPVCCGPSWWKWWAPRWLTASRRRSSTAWDAPPSP